MTFEEAYQQIRKHHYEILNERESVSKSAKLSLSTWVLDILTECRVADTPQTDCETCKYFGHDELEACGYCRHEDLYEPQTDGIIFKGNLKEGDYKLIKTTDGWVLDGGDIVYCGWERKDE